MLPVHTYNLSGKYASTRSYYYNLQLISHLCEKNMWYFVLERKNLYRFVHLCINFFVQHASILQYTLHDY